MAGSIRVLVVDDEPLVRLTLGRAIARQPDMEVVGEAADGAEAVRRVSALRPDVVIMDVTMPSLSGIEAAIELRRRGFCTPILFFTGDPGAFEKAKPVDASRVLIKAGGSAAEALAAVRHLASEALTASSTPRAVAGLRTIASARSRASSGNKSPDMRRMRSALPDG